MLVLLVIQLHTVQLGTTVLLAVVVLVVVVGLLCPFGVLGLSLLPALVMAYAGNRSMPPNQKR